MILNIRNTRLDQSSPVQQNPEKKMGKITCFKKSKIEEEEKIRQIKKTKNAIILVLPIKEIIL